MLRLAVLLFFTAGLTYADTAPAQLTNEGKPLRVPFTCAQEDLEPLGLDCSENEPCPVFLELSAVASAGSRVIVSGNIHTSAATISSILLASADGGKTWAEPYQRIHAAALEQIQFLDFANGWVSGEAIQALPRDPFFLITNDGGKTWRNRPVSEESRPGVIEHFWFDSQTTGSLVLALKGVGYEMYETMTGGDNWELRQTSSKPLALARGHAGEETGWRVRADRKSHSYDVEIKEANGWRSISSFLVDIATCR